MDHGWIMAGAWLAGAWLAGAWLAGAWVGAWEGIYTGGYYPGIAQQGIYTTHPGYTLHYPPCCTVPAKHAVAPCSTLSTFCQNDD